MMYFDKDIFSGTLKYFSFTFQKMKQNKVNCKGLIPQQRQHSQAIVVTFLGKKLKNYCIVFLKYLIEYCNNSSLHGLKYIFNNHLSITER